MIELVPAGFELGGRRRVGVVRLGRRSRIEGVISGNGGFDGSHAVWGVFEVKISGRNQRTYVLSIRLEAFLDSRVCVREREGGILRFL